LNYRTATFARENGIGIRLAGGNKCGIFICDVQYNSPAERAGLKIADKIIRVNNLDYSNLTREEAVQHILSISNLIDMVVAHSPEEYESCAFDQLGGDSFYVRSHFNYTNANPNELSFRINDILHVTDTLYNGVIGNWVASKLTGNTNNETSCIDDQRGVIPNQPSAEQLVSQAPTIDQVSASATVTAMPTNTTQHAATTSSDAINSSTASIEKHQQQQQQATSKDDSVLVQSSRHNRPNHPNYLSIGASARMSLRKKLAFNKQRSKSASRSNATSTDASTTNANIKVLKANTFTNCKYHTYERVVLREVNFARPIVLFGPLADVAREKLKNEQPNKYEIPGNKSIRINLSFIFLF
jgi:hypothetical protein